MLADRMHNEAGEKLKKTVEKKDIVVINIAQLMFEAAGNAKSNTANGKKDDIEKLQKSVEKRKSQNYFTVSFEKTKKKCNKYIVLILILFLRGCHTRKQMRVCHPLNMFFVYNIQK